MEESTVTNIVVGPLPAEVSGAALYDRPVAIGDTQVNGVFLRDGEPVLTDAERIAALEQQILTLQEQLNS
jgi:hypothetical protein